MVPAKALASSACHRAISLDHLVSSGKEARGHVEAEHFCGLEIEDEFDPGRLHDRKVGGFLAPENATGVGADLAVGLGKTIPVAHQAAFGGELPPLVDRRNRMARRQCYQLVAVAVEERIGRDDERANPLLDEICKDRIDFALGACVEDTELAAEPARGRHHLFRLALGRRIVRIDKIADRYVCGHHLVQQL